MEQESRTVNLILPKPLLISVLKDTNNSNVDAVLTQLPESFDTIWGILEDICIARHSKDDWEIFKQRHYDTYLKYWYKPENPKEIETRQDNYMKGKKSFVAPLSIFEISLRFRDDQVIDNKLSVSFFKNDRFIIKETNILYEKNKLSIEYCSITPMKRKTKSNKRVYVLTFLNEKVQVIMFETMARYITKHFSEFKLGDGKTATLDAVFACYEVEFEKLMFYIITEFNLKVVLSLSKQISQDETYATETFDPIIRSCITCGIPSNTKCGGPCNNNTTYCGIECQQIDWENHKYFCSF